MPVKIRFTNQGVIEEYIKKDSGDVPDVSFEIEAYDKDGNVLGGGGGVTIIADGGTIGGIYDGDVLCEGAVTMDDDVVVRGNLTVFGLFTNDTGRALTVFGNLKTLSNVNFDRANTALSQAPIGVYGDWHAGGSSISFVQSGGSSANILVGGDFIGTQGGGPTTSLYAYGLDDNHGAGIYVQGDVYLYYIGLDGGTADLTGAGNGGFITVYGNLHTGGDINCRGGYSGNVGSSAGNGGNVIVYGNLICGDDFRNRGGNGDVDPAGSAGGVEVYGDLIVDDNFDCNGGASNGGAGGSGANVYVYGNVTCNSSLDLYGGIGTAGGNAGSLYCFGSVSVDGVYLYGGNATNGGGGNGGWLQVYGDLNSRNTTDLSGGQSAGANSGANCSTSTFGTLNGPGCLYVAGNVNAGAMQANGGAATGTGAGGNGGLLEVGGSLNVINGIIISGGTSTAGGNGGTAGSLYVVGDLNSGLGVVMAGGDASDPTVAYTGGTGGSLVCNGFTKAGSIVSAGGNVAAAAGTHGAPGAQLNFRGGAACSDITFIDGFTGAASAPSATCTVKLSGNCTINNLNVTDRTQLLVVSGDAGDPPAILKINTLSGPGGYAQKNTLNNRTSGVPTAWIAAAIADSLFISDLGGAWYSITGVAV